MDKNIDHLWFLSSIYYGKLYLSAYEKHAHQSKLKEWTWRHKVQREARLIKMVLQDQVSGGQTHPELLQGASYL